MSGEAVYIMTGLLASLAFALVPAYGIELMRKALGRDN